MKTVEMREVVERAMVRSNSRGEVIVNKLEGIIDVTLKYTLLAILGLSVTITILTAFAVFAN